jgi:hypothetical protein
MNYQTHNDGDIDISGSRLQAYLYIGYDKLVKALGLPLLGDNDKIDAEWNILFDDNVLATVYNYKTGRSYLGDDGLDVHEITEWHIGGHTPEAVEKLLSILDTTAEIILVK